MSIATGYHKRGASEPPEEPVSGNKRAAPDFPLLVDLGLEKIARQIDRSKGTISGLGRDSSWINIKGKNHISGNLHEQKG